MPKRDDPALYTRTVRVSGDAVQPVFLCALHAGLDGEAAGLLGCAASPYGIGKRKVAAQKSRKSWTQSTFV